MNAPFVFSPRNTNTRTAVLIGTCIFLIALFRVVRAAFLPELPNFSPVSALAFCGGLFLPGIAAWILPLGALLLSDIALSMVMGYPPFSAGQSISWLCIVITIALGRWLATRSFCSLPRLAGMLFIASFFFYLVTNAMSWVFNPAYPHSWSGLWASLTVGLPGFPPTWMFFRNSLISDFLFAGMGLVIWTASQASSKETQKALAT